MDRGYSWLANMDSALRSRPVRVACVVARGGHAHHLHAYRVVRFSSIAHSAGRLTFRFGHPYDLRMQVKAFEAGLTLDYIQTMYPSRLICIERETNLDRPGSQYFGYVAKGNVKIQRPGLEPIPLSQGMYFTAPSELKVQAQGALVVWERLGYQGLFMVGGPVESSGRLTYIDNCSTTMIAPPARALDPVLNLLCFPKKTQQTMHIHPTIRLGYVSEGQGEFITPGKTMELREGLVFAIPEKTPHCFHTQDSTMSVIAYHAESHIGPTDEQHPMLNQTYRKL